MLADNVLIPGEIDAERLVIRHIALDPLNIRAEATQGVIGRGRAELFPFECPNLGNIPFDDESLPCQFSLKIFRLTGPVLLIISS